MSEQPDADYPFPLRCTLCGIYFSREFPEKDRVLRGEPVPCPACGVEEGKVVPRSAVPEDQPFVPTTRTHALDPCVLCAARTRVEGAWKAYVKPVPGICHRIEYQDVLDTGSEIEERIARVIFPSWERLRYSR